MSIKSRRITSLIVRGISLLCSVAALLALLDGFLVKTRIDVYEKIAGDLLASDTGYDYVNFFGYLEILNYRGWDLKEGQTFIGFLVVAIVIAVALVVFDVISLIRKKSFTHKVLKIAFLAASAVALVAFILAIGIEDSSGHWYYCDGSYEYYSGYRFWVETRVQGSYTVLASIILIAVTFAAQAFAGVLGLFAKKEPVVEAQAPVGFGDPYYSENTVALGATYADNAPAAQPMYQQPVQPVDNFCANCGSRINPDGTCPNCRY